jgi:hypothetical protein
VPDTPIPSSEDARKREEAGKLAEMQAERQRLIAEREAQEQAEAYAQLLKENAAKEAEDTKKREEVQRRREQDELQARLQLRNQEDAQRNANRSKLQKEEKRRPADIKVPTGKADSPVASPTSASNKWGFFKRRKGDDSPKSPLGSPPVTADSRPKTSHATTSSRSYTMSSPPRLRKSAEAPSAPELPTIKPGGGGIVPGIDAPVSAVNANERRVMVECGRSSLRFPVTPETTPLQLIRSASNCMAEDFDPRAAFILEVYSKANVQRPLRMYEHVRDVINSWDSDEQHSLVITPSTQDGDNELYAAFAPKKQPEGGQWVMYYSNKPGKWDKRVITLKPEGELCYDKSNGKDTIRICHLSDFDVYAIMPKRMKKVSPKKKYCWAIKSQQKSSMFMDMSSYIHLFACGEQQTANSFYHTIQEWRSWYLVDIMGEGQKSKGEQQKKEPTRNYLTASIDEKVHQSKSAPHLRTASVESHYVLGTFNTLDFNVDQMMAEEKKPVEDKPPPLANLGISAVEHTRIMHEKMLAERRRPAPPVSFPKALNTRSPHDNGIGQMRSTGSRNQPSRDRDGRDPRSREGRSPTNGTFAMNGLLGKEYAERQRQNQARDGRPRSPGGLNPSQYPPQQQQAVLRRSGSNRSQHSIAARRSSFDNIIPTNNLRGGPPHMLPKPLIDLTPQYKEAPQFQKRGRGVRPDQPGALVDAIASPEDPINAPPSRDWRRPQTSAGPGDRERGRNAFRDAHRMPPPNGYPPLPPGPIGGTPYAYEQTKSLKGHGVKLEVSAPNPATGNIAVGANEPAFTGGGLLGRMDANQKGGWGAGNRGHGYARGSDARGAPMMDVREQSRFQKGSLLGNIG